MSENVFLRPFILLIPLASLVACTGVRGPDLPSQTDPAAAETSSTQSTGSNGLTPNDAATANVTEPGAVETPATAVEAPEPESASAPIEPLPPSANPAVIALLETAHKDFGAGRLPTATATIERALRIEPRNPMLWQELARLKLQKGEYQQAESLAARSNSWAIGNKPLLAENWRIISEARSLRGDNEGAKAAQARAVALESQPESAVHKE